MSNEIINYITGFVWAVSLLAMAVVVLNFLFTLGPLAITPGDALYTTVQPLIVSMRGALKFAIPGVAGVILLLWNLSWRGY